MGLVHKLQALRLEYQPIGYCAPLQTGGRQRPPASAPRLMLPLLTCGVPTSGSLSLRPLPKNKTPCLNALYPSKLSTGRQGALNSLLILILYSTTLKLFVNCKGSFGIPPRVDLCLYLLPWALFIHFQKPPSMLYRRSTRHLGSGHSRDSLPQLQHVLFRGFGLRAKHFRHLPNIPSLSTRIILSCILHHHFSSLNNTARSLMVNLTKDTQLDCICL